MPLLNLRLPDIAGIFVAPVCGKKLSDDCARSAYKLADHRIGAMVFFKPLNSTYFFGRFFLGPPFEESQKIADLGAVAKFAIT